MQRRCPCIKVLLANASVQGSDAPASLIQALHKLEKRKDVDVIIIGRGGGSYEDLFCFNDEKLARSVAACTKPIISAVGHESDFTLCDFAADYRAATPTAAATKASPEADTLIQKAQDLCNKIHNNIQKHLSNQRKELEHIAHRVSLRNPKVRLKDGANELKDMKNRLGKVVQRIFKQYKDHLKELKATPILADPKRIIIAKIQELDYLSAELCDPQKRIIIPRRRELYSIKEKLEALSPSKVLSRGYSIVADKNGHAISTLAELAKEELICITVSDGKAEAEIKQYHINNA